MIDETGQRILRLIDVHKDQIIAFAEDIAAHPEPGYEEFCTAGKTAEVLKNLGYKVTEHLARTGVKGTKSIKEGPSLTVIGELDWMSFPSQCESGNRRGTCLRSSCTDGGNDRMCDRNGRSGCAEMSCGNCEFSCSSCRGVH